MRIRGLILCVAPLVMLAAPLVYESVAPWDNVHVSWSPLQVEGGLCNSVDMGEVVKGVLLPGKETVVSDTPLAVKCEWRTEHGNRVVVQVMQITNGIWIGDMGCPKQGNTALPIYICHQAVTWEVRAPTGVAVVAWASSTTVSTKVLASTPTESDIQAGFAYRTSG